MKTYAALILVVLLGLACTKGFATDIDVGPNTDIVDQILLNRSLLIAAQKAVIIDRVSLPPDTTLSRRWHPGEMFVYVIDGTVVIALDDLPDIVGNTGELIEIPLRHVYSARTNDKGAQLVIFRIHEADKPMRVLVE